MSPRAEDPVRDALKARLTEPDVVALFAELGVKGIERINDNGGKPQYKSICPFPHDGGEEENPSFNFTTDQAGLYHCQGCSKSGDLFTLWTSLREVGYREVLTELATRYGIEVAQPGRRAPLTHVQIEEWHRRLIHERPKLDLLMSRRGITLESIKQYLIGFDGQRYTIPVMDETGSWANVRRYSFTPKAGQAKMAGYGTGFNAARLFPFDSLQADSILLVEGEWDAILANQEITSHHGGLPVTAAITATGGAGTWDASWTPLFKDKIVYIAYDRDRAGEAGAKRVAEQLRTVTRVYLVKYPAEVGNGGDFTDYVQHLGRNMEDFFALLSDAELVPDLAPIGESPEEPPINIQLGSASLAAYAGKRVRTKGFISGKDDEPFTLPARLEMTCTMDAGAACTICPYQSTGCANLKLTARVRETLSMVNATDAQQKTAIREMLGIPKQCGRYTVEVPEMQNMEEVRVISDIDSNGPGADYEAVTRRALIRGHGLQPNRAYNFSGYVYPDPKTQHAVHLVDQVEPAEDSIKDFSLTPERLVELKAVFGRREGERPIDALRRHYEEMAWHATGIHGRFLLHAAYDITYCSHLSIQLGRKLIRKGYAEMIVIGDSGTGKTTHLQGLMRHYRAGERISGENVTTAGLLGGLQKMGERWILSWGRLPQNDRRLLALDECGDMEQNVLSQMSDTRSSGVAEITKIKTERTAARTRLIMLGNPRDGRSLDSFPTGVDAMRLLIGKNEDARRFTYGMAVRSGEVPPDVIRRAQQAPPKPLEARSDLCRDRVLFNWSRGVDDVVFPKDTEAAVHAAAVRMGKKYHASFPLAEPSDLALKVATVSASLAGATFNTTDGQKILVEVIHVEDAEWLMEQWYATIQYDLYSKQQRLINDMDEDRLAEVLPKLTRTYNWDLVVTALSNSMETFNKKELQELAGVGADQADVLLQLLTRNHLVSRDRYGYRKNPGFVALINKEVERIMAAGGPKEEVITMVGGTPDF